jgi:hypothetical protein
MPQFLEQALQKAAAKKGLSGKSANSYVYGAMNKMGAMKGNQETAKGAAMDAKHKKDTLKSALFNK